METIELAKDGGAIILIKEGKTIRRRSIVDRELIVSLPPNGCCQVLDIYVNPESGKLVVVYDDTIVERGEL